MKLKFCEFIKKAKIKQSFYDCDTGNKHTITKIAKTYTWTKERLGNGYKEWEEVEWKNIDNDEIIF